MPTSAQNPFQVTESSPSPPLPEPPEQVVFGIANHKGGVFKTGFALVFSQAMSWMQNRMEDILPPRFRDAKILLVDSDPQGNLTEAVGFDPVEIAKSIKDFLEFPNAKSVRDLADNFGILDTPTDNVYLIWAMVIVFLLFVGMFMETLAAILILTPVLLPVMYTMGADPTHVGIVVICTLSIR